MQQSASVTTRFVRPVNGSVSELVFTGTSVKGLATAIAEARERIELDENVFEVVVSLTVTDKEREGIANPTGRSVSEDEADTEHTRLRALWAKLDAESGYAR